MKASTKKRIWELLQRFAVFTITSGAGTLVDLGVHWWLSAAFLQDRYWWTFWVAPVISFDTVCLGHSNVASSEAYLEDELPSDCIGTSMALARGMGEGNAGLAAQSYIIWLRNSSWDGTSITFAHRGGYYVKPTEVFGPGIIY